MGSVYDGHMASARVAAITAISVTALLAASIAGLSVWFVRGGPSGDEAPNEHERRNAFPPANAGIPAGYVRMKIGGVAPTRSGNAVVLMDPDEQRALLIFVGGTEALSIGLRLQNRKYPRPLTHDLVDRVLGEFDGHIVRAQVDRLQQGVFFGSVYFTRGQDVVRLDSRPSDALALAVGSAAPIFVAQQLIDDAGVDLGGVEVQAPDEIDPETLLEEPAGQVSL